MSILKYNFIIYLTCLANRLDVFYMYAPIDEGFADEVFRVFQKKHPDTELIPVNANASVADMIKHVQVNL